MYNILPNGILGGSNAIYRLACVRIGGRTAGRPIGFYRINDLSENFGLAAEDRLFSSLRLQFFVSDKPLLVLFVCSVQSCLR